MVYNDMYNLKYHTLLTGKDDDSEEWPVITGLMVNFKRHHIYFSSQILLPDPLTYSKPKKTRACGFSEPPLNGTTETVLSDKPANKHHQMVMGLPVPWLHQRKEDLET